MSSTANPWSTPHLRSLTSPAPNWRPSTGPQGAVSTQPLGESSAATQREMRAELQQQQQPVLSQPSAPQSARTTMVHAAGSAPHTAALPSTPVAAVPAPAVASSRPTARSQLLQAATSLGLHGWCSTLPSQPPPAANAPVPPCPSRFDAVDGAGGLADFDEWLRHQSRVLTLMRAHSDLQRESDAMQAALEAHEREQETAGVTAVGVMDMHADRTWTMAQHLSALLSSHADTPVEQRNPQPSQFHLVARDRDAASQFTPAPAQVHPHVRKLLQQPYGHHSGQSVRYIQVEPELQSVVCSELERMCQEVAEWSAASSHAGDRDGHTHAEDRKPSADALTWSSTLQQHQQPMDALLSSVVGSWARVQRAGDELSSLHSVTKQLQRLEQEYDTLRQQAREEESMNSRVHAATGTRY